MLNIVLTMRNEMSIYCKITFIERQQASRILVMCNYYNEESKRKT